MMRTETVKLLAVKTLLYRTMAAGGMAVIAYLTTGSVKLALFFGGVEAFLKTAVYFCYELAWRRIMPAPQQQDST